MRHDAFLRVYRLERRRGSSLARLLGTVAESHRDVGGTVDCEGDRPERDRIVYRGLDRTNSA